MRKYFLRMSGCVVMALAGNAFGSGADVVLVKDGSEALPIVVAADAPASVRRAADDLSKILGQISGKSPEVRSTPPAAGEGAIWIGFHKELAALFPGKVFTWKHPEEIAIVSEGGNVAILGKDVQAGEIERESGTANAVYTFAQKFLGVRWLWPGTLGADYPSEKTVSLPPTDYRYHPQFVQRGVFRNLKEPVPNSQNAWCLEQRIYQDSFKVPVGHAFTEWWDKYGKDHPEYFALQPDGTRGTFPEKPNRKKVSEGEPKVWAQWLADVDKELATDPSISVLNASANDSANAGICVDPRSRAWDHPKGKLWRYEWKGDSKEEPAMTNRYITFWNILAKMLKEKHPERDVFVYGMAYGPSKPPPIDLAIEKNVAIGYVGHLPMLDDHRRVEERAEIVAWGKLTKNLFFRPNIALYSGGFHGIPAVTFKNTIEDIRFLAENGCRGLIIDTLPDHWSTQGPMYYLITQLAWDPLQDGEAVLTDYYKRGFGPAAKSVRAYFEHMEKAHMAIINRPDWIHSGRMGKPLSEYMIAEAYTPEVLAKGRAILNTAAKEAAGDTKFSERVAFIAKGLDFTEKLIPTMKVMNRVRESEGKDFEAVAEAERLVAEREAFFESENEAAKKSRSIAPISSHRFKVTYTQTRGLLDHVGPVSDAFRKAAAKEKAHPTTGWQKSDSGAARVSGSAKGGTEYQWTGKAANGLWATPGNWEVKTPAGWRPSPQPPGPGSTVRLGAGAKPDQRVLNLTANTEAACIIYALEEADAEYVIQTRPDADTEGLDSDSGMLFTLKVTDAEPIRQEAGAKGTLSFRSKLELSGDKPRVGLEGTDQAVVEIAGQLVSAPPAEQRGGSAAKGRLVIKTEAAK